MQRPTLAWITLMLLPAGASAAITAVVALDRSKSLQRWCDQLVQDLDLLVEPLGEEDQIVLLAFDERAEVLGRWSAKAPDGRRRLHAFRCTGARTSLSAALKAAWEILDREPPDRRRVLVLMTDGVADMGSRQRTALEIERLQSLGRDRPQGVRVLLVGYVTGPESRSGLLRLREMLDARLVPVPTPEDLRRVLRDPAVIETLKPALPGPGPRPVPRTPIAVLLVVGALGIGAGAYVWRKSRARKSVASAMDLRRPHPPSPRAVSLAILDPTRGTRRVETLRMLPGDQATVGSAMTDTVRVEGLQPRHLVVQVRDAEEVWLGIPEGIRLKVNGRLQRGPAAIPVPPEGLMVETGTLRITLAPEV